MPIPPLVEPGPALTAAQSQQFSHHVLLPEVGPEGQRRLLNARVCVVGAGSLGAAVLSDLAAAGMGSLGIVGIGHGAPGSARDAAPASGRGVDVVVHPDRLTPENAEAVLSGYDLVIDAADDIATRYLVDDTCGRLGLPEVWGSVVRCGAQVSVFWGRPPAGSGVDPVSLRDAFPDPPVPGDEPSGADSGVLGALCGQVAALMATEAVKLVIGIGDPLLGRVLVLDALAARWSEIDVRPSGPSAPAGVTAIAARDLAAWLAAPEAGRPVLVDVREPAEHRIVAIPGSRLIPLGRLRDGSAIGELPRDRPIVLICRTGARSAQGLQILRSAGLADLRHLDGGILAWVDEVDTTLPRY
jgi:molybdopterin/thiamine biosynthesis adenylyltransferase/rhodanese-related sulfurtransferase